MNEFSSSNVIVFVRFVLFNRVVRGQGEQPINNECALLSAPAHVHLDILKITPFSKLRLNTQRIQTRVPPRRRSCRCRSHHISAARTSASRTVTPSSTRWAVIDDNLCVTDVSTSAENFITLSRDVLELRRG